MTKQQLNPTQRPDYFSWHSVKIAPGVWDDVIEIARATGRKPGEVIADLCREALRRSALASINRQQPQ